MVPYTNENEHHLFEGLTICITRIFCMLSILPLMSLIRTMMATLIQANWLHLSMQVIPTVILLFYVLFIN